VLLVVDRGRLGLGMGWLMRLDRRVVLVRHRGVCGRPSSLECLRVVSFDVPDVGGEGTEAE